MPGSVISDILSENFPTPIIHSVHITHVHHTFVIGKEEVCFLWRCCVLSYRWHLSVSPEWTNGFVWDLCLSRKAYVRDNWHAQHVNVWKQPTYLHYTEQSPENEVRPREAMDLTTAVVIMCVNHVLWVWKEMVQVG